MKHGKSSRKFSRSSKQRKALLRDLARALVLNGKIKTTQAKAKGLRPYVEKLITTGKAKNLTANRLLTSQLGAGPAKKLVTEIADKFAGRHGGYTRIINLTPRSSDGAKMALIELVE